MKNVTLVHRSLSLFAGIALALATMSFRAAEIPVKSTTSIVLTSSTILVVPNDVLTADHVVVTLRNPSGAIIGTRYTSPGQMVTFSRPADYCSGYVVRSEYFGPSNNFMIGDDMQM